VVFKPRVTTASAKAKMRQGTESSLSGSFCRGLLQPFRLKSVAELEVIGKLPPDDKILGFKSAERELSRHIFCRRALHLIRKIHASVVSIGEEAVLGGYLRAREEPRQGMCVLRVICRFLECIQPRAAR